MAGARNERRLLGVGSSARLGAVPGPQSLHRPEKSTPILPVPPLSRPRPQPLRQHSGEYVSHNSYLRTDKLVVRMTAYGIQCNQIYVGEGEQMDKISRDGCMWNVECIAAQLTESVKSELFRRTP